jgi:hypothetical protein
MIKLDRKQLYNDIINLNLRDEVKSTYGKNYTVCSNEQLKAVLDKAVAALEPVSAVGASPFNKLVEILAKKKILLKSEVDAIKKA